MLQIDIWLCDLLSSQKIVENIRNQTLCWRIGDKGGGSLISSPIKPTLE